jgi:tetratricopeptide (TPR) repeat protein
MKKILLLFVFILSVYAYSQPPTKTDSLTALIKKTDSALHKGKLLLKRSKLLTTSSTNDSYNDAISALQVATTENDKSTQLEALTQLSAVFFVKENFQKALDYDNQALALAEKENDNIGKINAYKSMSRNQKALGNIKESVANAEKAKEIAIENKLPQELASINNALGVAYRNNNDFQKSLNVLNEALTQTKSKKLIALLKMNKANTLTEMMRLDEAIENHLESLNINEELNDTKGKQQVYNNLGNLFKKAKQYDKSIHYIQKSIKISQANNSKLSTAIGYDNLATVYDLANKKDSIIWYRKNAIAIFESIKDEKNAARSYHNLGNYYLLHNQLAAAEKYLLIALKKRIQINAPFDIASTKTELGILYDKKKQFDKAEFFLNEAKILLEDIVSDKKEEFLQAYSNHFKWKGELETALKIKDEQLLLKDSLLHETEIIDVIKKENDFVVESQNQKIVKLQSVEENLSKSKVIYGILIFLVFLLALYSFVRWKKSDFKKRKIMSEKLLIEDKHSLIVEELKSVKQLVNEGYLILKNNKKVYLNELEYIKAEDHYLEVFTKSKNELVRGTISEILLQLPPNFSQSHRSFLVNKNYIKTINTKEILLKNNVVIPLTRKYKGNF